MNLNQDPILLGLSAARAQLELDAPDLVNWLDQQALLCGATHTVPATGVRKVRVYVRGLDSLQR